MVNNTGETDVDFSDSSISRTTFTNFLTFFIVLTPLARSFVRVFQLAKLRYKDVIIT